MEITPSHPSMVQWFAGSFNKLIPERKRSARIMDNDRKHIPTEVLKEYVCDAIPELCNKDIPTPRAWTGPTHNVETPHFIAGQYVAWNDMLIPKDHGARVGCGDGPFEILKVEDYIMAFTHAAHQISKIEIPDFDRVILRAPKGNIVIAHAAYFVHAQK